MVAYSRSNQLTKNPTRAGICWSVSRGRPGRHAAGNHAIDKAYRMTSGLIEMKAAKGTLRATAHVASHGRQRIASSFSVPLLSLPKCLPDMRRSCSGWPIPVAVNWRWAWLGTEVGGSAVILIDKGASEAAWVEPGQIHLHRQLHFPGRGRQRTLSPSGLRIWPLRHVQGLWSGVGCLSSLPPLITPMDPNSGSLVRYDQQCPPPQNATPDSLPHARSTDKSAQ